MKMMYTRLLVVTVLLIGSFANAVVAQCPVTASASATNILCGDTIKITAKGTPTDYVIKTDFNTGANQPGPGWSTTPSASYGNPCGPGAAGSICMWMGDAANVPRTLTTAPFACNFGAQITFDMRYATQGGASPCEGIDLPNEGVYLQYSTGGPWTTIQYYNPNGGNDPIMTNWKTYSVPLPPAAQSATTSIRWFQQNSSGITTDHWGLDNIEIVRPSPSFVFDWQHDPATPSPSSYTPPVAPFSSTTYTVVHTDNNGSTCTAAVAVNVAQPTATVTAQPQSVCAGGQTQLNVNSFQIPPAPSNCGLSATGCQGTTRIIDIGTTTATNTNYYFFGRAPGAISSCTNGVGNTDAAIRIQMIYLKSEFPAYFYGGQIYNMALNVTSATNANCKGFTIKMGCTSKTSFTGTADWVAPASLTTVYTGKDLNLINGVNTIEFDNVFDWNGAGNIVVQICFNGGADGSGFTTALQGNVAKTVTPFTSVNYIASCGVQACDFTTPANSTSRVDTYRPSTKFGICYRVPPVLAYSWAPAGDMSSATIQNPIATVPGAKTYFVTVSDANRPNCTVASSINITTAGPAVSVTPNPTLVCNTSSASVVITANPSTTSPGTPSYTYAWTPPTRLSSTTAQSPTASPTVNSTYTVKVTDQAGCTATTTVQIGYCMVIPLKLLDFTGKKNGSGILLSWKTIEEKGLSHFEIEKQDRSAKYFALGQVPASSLHTAAKSYSLTDFKPNEGLNYYRLKAYDVNGKLDYSVPLQVYYSSVRDGYQLNLIQLGDDADSHVLQIKTVESRAFSLNLTTVDGKQLSHIEIPAFEGEYTITLPTTTLASGIYLLNVNDASGNSSVLKLVK